MDTGSKNLWTENKNLSTIIDLLRLKLSKITQKHDESVKRIYAVTQKTIEAKEEKIKEFEKELSDSQERALNSFENGKEELAKMIAKSVEKNVPLPDTPFYTAIINNLLKTTPTHALFTMNNAQKALSMVENQKEKLENQITTLNETIESLNTTVKTLETTITQKNTEFLYHQGLIQTMKDHASEVQKDFNRQIETKNKDFLNLQQQQRQQRQQLAQQLKRQKWFTAAGIIGGIGLGIFATKFGPSLFQKTSLTAFAVGRASMNFGSSFFSYLPGNIMNLVK